MNYIVRNTQWFIDNRPEIFKFVSKINQNKKHISVKAPVKSGKRYICIVYALLNQRQKHYYLSALDRIDDQVQLDELENGYGIETFLSKDIDKLVNCVIDSSPKFDEVVVHLNESDYGTGNRQRMADGIKAILKIENVRLILYSATNEEAEYSKFITNAAIEEFVPPASYHGYGWFLNQGLVQNATDFWDLENDELTEQGIECCEILKASNKIFGVVRFTNQTQIKKTSFESTIRNQYGFSVKWISAKKGEEYDWGGDFYKDVGFRDYENKDHKVLLVICQTATRSTEIGFHEHIAFWHDSERGRGTAYNTIIQAAGRVIHYDKGPLKPVSVIVYSDIEEWKRAAGLPNESKRKGSMRMKAKIADRLYYERVVFDLPPSEEDCRREWTIRGGRPGFDKTTNLHASENYKTDPIKNVLNDPPRLPQRRSEYMSILVLDKPTPTTQNSWDNLVVKNGLEGKYILLVEKINHNFDRTDITTKKSMYENI